VDDREQVGWQVIHCSELEGFRPIGQLSVATSDNKTLSATAAVPVACSCTAKVQLTGAGSYKRDWTW